MTKSGHSFSYSETLLFSPNSDLAITEGSYVSASRARRLLPRIFFYAHYDDDERVVDSLFFRKVQVDERERKREKERSILDICPFAKVRAPACITQLQGGRGRGERLEHRCLIFIQQPREFDPDPRASDFLYTYALSIFYTSDRRDVFLIQLKI